MTETVKNTERKLRILWSSNSPFCQTGYGLQTASVCSHLSRAGFPTAIFAFYGLEGTMLNWGDIPIYPNNARDWGLKHARYFYDDWQADVYISLIDSWVLSGLDQGIHWVPWVPIDHDPIPPLVLDVLKNSFGLVRPIAMSQYGYKKLTEAGIKSFYIPHGIDTKVYSADPKARKESRAQYDWEDKFVIGTVATNHSERKNWCAMMKAVAKFTKGKDDVVWYCHTNPLDDRGINLALLRENLGLEKVTFFPSRIQIQTGIDSGVMARAYNSMDVFLLPSKGEGFGIPIVEAQACGVPVIVSDNTSQTELCGGGWLVKKQIPVWTGQSSWQFDSDVDEIWEKLEMAYQAKKDGSINDIRKQARQLALQYDEETIFHDRWLPALDEIARLIKQPKNGEGVQLWRKQFIPQSCSPEKVLDIGCGITQPYKPLLQHLGEYVGVDIREGPGVVIADAHKLPFNDGEFGFVWMSEVLEHLSNPEQALREARRVGVHGVCLFNTPQNPSFNLDPDHKVVNLPYMTLATGDGFINW